MKTPTILFVIIPNLHGPVHLLGTVTWRKNPQIIRTVLRKENMK